MPSLCRRVSACGDIFRSALWLEQTLLAHGSFLQCAAPNLYRGPRERPVSSPNCGHLPQNLREYKMPRNLRQPTRLCAMKLIDVCGKHAAEMNT